MIYDFIEKKMKYNVNPRAWGPHGWKFMHYVTVAYPDDPTDQDKHQMEVFFLSIKNVLPCKMCRDHFEETLEKHPLDEHALASRHNLVKWMIKVHNEVNKATGKRSVNISVNEYISYYSR